MKRLKHTSHGFSLIEIIAVLLILGILAAVAVSRFEGTSQASLLSASARLRTHLRHAQILAMNTNAPWYVQFDGASYKLNRYGAHDNPISFPGEESDTVDFGSGFSLSYEGPDYVTFDSLGRPCGDLTGKELRSEDRTIFVRKGGESVSITITRNTGFIP